MEKEEITGVDPFYKKGFEHGYWLHRGNSKELENVLEKSKNHAAYSNGLKAGKKQSEKEKIVEKINIANDQTKSYGREI